MADTRKFPLGYDVRIIKKEDIIKTIDENIIDKEVAIAIIKRLEIDAANFVKNGQWAGIPHLGSFRIRLATKLAMRDESKQLIADARDNLEKDRYILFRKDLAAEYKKLEKAERYFKYVVSKQANKNKELYRSLAKKRGENYAQLYLYLTSTFTPVGDKPKYYGN